MSDKSLIVILVIAIAIVTVLLIAIAMVTVIIIAIMIAAMAVVTTVKVAGWSMEYCFNRYYASFASFVFVCPIMIVLGIYLFVYCIFFVRFCNL